MKNISVNGPGDKRIRKTNLSAIAQQFDWQTMAPFYDKVFNTI